MKKKILIVEDQFVEANDVQLILERQATKSAGVEIQNERPWHFVKKTSANLPAKFFRAQKCLAHDHVCLLVHYLPE